MSWYRLLHPRPVAILIAGREKPNPMALSWHTPIDDEDQLLAVVIDKSNYTYRIIKEEGEFTLNFLPIDKLDIIWFCGTRSGREVDKISVLGLRLAEGVKIKTKHLQEALAYIECSVTKEIDFGETAIFIAKVVYWEASMHFDTIWKQQARIAMHVGSKYFCTPSEYHKAKR